MTPSSRGAGISLMQINIVVGLIAAGLIAVLWASTNFEAARSGLARLRGEVGAELRKLRGEISDTANRLGDRVARLEALDRAVPAARPSGPEPGEPARPRAPVAAQPAARAYRFVDETGGIHYVQNFQSVPREHRGAATPALTTRTGGG
jgi:hypothetical protein